MHRAETHLQQADRHICEAEYRITCQERLSPMLERCGQTAAPYAPHLLTAMLAGLDASWAHRRVLLLRRD